ncbi:hypothetical protein EST38_g8548 [Candolleomyces aberdarensis]|uniref:Uncharacterized protein n=1 Tax=Candolleomyces aberdarensis TaxID=2316362 RepID=A0A4V1Q345_9AGAR|nr:hypothetical protein EST38_g8548 [Candolleomyces aberdarensis]
MPHPLSVQLAGLMEGDDSLYTEDAAVDSRSTGAGPRRVGRVRHSSNRLLLKLCTNTLQRRSQKKSPSSPIPSSVDLLNARTSCHSTSNLPSSPPTILSKTGCAKAVLPLEILNIIVTNDLKHDIPTLKSFSLSCRYFCRKTRPLIFNRLKLYMHPSHRKTRGIELCELLATSRHLLPYIKHAMLFNLFPEDSCFSSQREDREALRMLMNLPALTKISIHSYNNKPWGSVPRDVQLAIKTSLRGKHVSSVEVIAMSDFPVYLLDGCRSLKELSLAASPSCYPVTDKDGVAKKTMTFPLPQHNRTPIHLERLSLTMSTNNLAELTDWILSSDCALDVSRVKSLQIRHRAGYSFYKHQMAVSGLLSECSATLEELEVDVYTPGHKVNITSPCPDQPESEETRTVEDVYKLLDIGRLACLRRLSLSFGLPDVYDQCRHVSLLAQMFRNCGKVTPSKLEEIGIFIWITNPCRELAEEDLRRRIVESGSWDMLDFFLSTMDQDRASLGCGSLVEGVPLGARVVGPSSVPRLQSLKIQLTKIKDREEAARLMNICLPRLTRRDVVHVQDRLQWID